jgi:hypothetical protein
MGEEPIVVWYLATAALPEGRAGYRGRGHGLVCSGRWWLKW